LIPEYLIEKTYYSLSTSDTTSKACNIFSKSNQASLPVVDSGEFLGMLSKNLIQCDEKKETKIVEFKELFRDISVYSESRMVSALKIMVKQGISHLPITDSTNEMIGVLSSDNLWAEFAKKSSLLEDGSWIIISMAKNDYSLSKIAHLVESHRLHIMMHYVQFSQNIDMVDVHLKLDRENINDLLQSLQRYGYHITGVIQPKKYVDDWEGKFDELMRFFST